MREFWNFRADIAIKLEMVASDFFQNHIDNIEIKNSYCKADAIESGSFAKAMIVLLLLKYCDENNCSINSFIAECVKYIGKGAHDFSNSEAALLFERFLELYKTDLF